MKVIRTSDQLPDDVGEVFVTDVPGSWFQLLGRRAYGELWVGSVIMQHKRKGQARPIADVAEMGVEIVRGPEAELLIEMFDEQHGEHIWQDVLRKGIKLAIARPENRTRQ